MLLLRGGIVNRTLVSGQSMGEYFERDPVFSLTGALKGEAGTVASTDSLPLVRGNVQLPQEVSKIARR